jgi:DNA-binding transcriptional regulator LsrR (DeoR family)
MDGRCSFMPTGDSFIRKSLIGCPDERPLLAASCERRKASGRTPGVAVGVDKARDVVGAVGAGLVEAIVTDSITAQSVLALLGTPDRATGEPPRPVAEGQ